ncbi:MAG: hypothetical protein M3Y76_04030 [Chloroflexota bacterium]|nr:hypothetical protein [Chloroflexota bacterium]
MSATFNYANILHAVGQVLDQVGVKSIAINEEEDGLFVEGFNSDGQLLVQMRYDIPALYDLVNRSEGGVEEKRTAENEGVLQRFLVNHELVGAFR